MSIIRRLALAIWIAIAAAAVASPAAAQAPPKPLKFNRCVDSFRASVFITPPTAGWDCQSPVKSCLPNYAIEKSIVWPPDANSAQSLYAYYCKDQRPTWPSPKPRLGAKACAAGFHFQLYWPPPPPDWHEYVCYTSWAQCPAGYRMISQTEQPGATFSYRCERPTRRVPGLEHPPEVFTGDPPPLPPWLRIEAPRN